MYTLSVGNSKLIVPMAKVIYDHYFVSTSMMTMTMYDDASNGVVAATAADDDYNIIRA